MAEKVRAYRCDRETYEKFKKAADEDGLSIGIWTLKCLKAAADQSGELGRARVRRHLRRKALHDASRNIEAALYHEAG